jgi:hypothetical protein
LQLPVSLVCHRPNRGQSTVRFSDLYSVRIKLVQSKIQRSRSRIRETTDFKIHLTHIVQGSSTVKCYEAMTKQADVDDFMCK